MALVFSLFEISFFIFFFRVSLAIRLSGCRAIEAESSSCPRSTKILDSQSRKVLRKRYRSLSCTSELPPRVTLVRLFPFLYFTPSFFPYSGTRDTSANVRPTDRRETESLRMSLNFYDSYFRALRLSRLLHTVVIRTRPLSWSHLSTRGHTCQVEGLCVLFHQV